MTPDWPSLRRAARDAAARSYSPYSGFAVGAAALLVDGSVVSGTNVENASYPLGLCAESAMVGVLIAGGHRPDDLAAVAVTDTAGEFLAPCGRCRQVLHEIGGPDLVVNGTTMAEWLPGAFTPADLDRS